MRDEERTVERKKKTNSNRKSMLENPAMPPN